MQTVFEKIIDKLEEEKMSYFFAIANTGDEKLDCAYEHTGDALDKAMEIVKQEAEKHEECYKDCGDCEAYNKEKHHCPKFCKVITEAVKEIEENHNKGKWEMTRYGSGNDETIITEYLENTHLEKGIKQKNFDTVLDLIDEYVDLKESVELVK